MRYLLALLTEVPMLRRMIEDEPRAEGIDLSNRVTLEVATASYRSIRGYTLAAAVFDELAYWPQEDSATPDEEILAALRPGLASIPGGVLLCASSPHARRARPAAEYGGMFRNEVERFIGVELVEAAVEPGCRVRALGVPVQGFCDPSGGASDSMTLAIGHCEKDDRAVLDCLVERRAPFSPTSVVSVFAETLKSYGVRKVTGDRYSGEWPREAFNRHGILYEPAEMPKSALYQILLPLLTSGRADLLDDPRLVT